MARIAGVNIPDKKRIVIALTYVYGIGRVRAQAIVKKARVDSDKKAGDLSAQELGNIREVVEKDMLVEGDLKREILQHVRRLRDVGSWRGMRHSKRLPVRGQRTKTNNRTVRGNVRKTVGSGKRPAASPT
jgi:small subunit ribosomal protein S13